MLATKALDALAAQPAPAPARAETLAAFWDRIGELDFWLRSDGHRRNPGTTADLVAASLFAAIQTGQIQPPFR